MKFKHIRRPEEAAPYVRNGNSLRLPMSTVAQFKTEAELLDFVYHGAVNFGYRGSMKTFFCEDSRTELDKTSHSITYKWKFRNE